MSSLPEQNMPEQSLMARIQCRDRVNSGTNEVEEVELRPWTERSYRAQSLKNQTSVGNMWSMAMLRAISIKVDGEDRRHLQVGTDIWS